MTDLKHIDGPVAVVTGGTSGIGLGIARALTSAGFRVVATYRSKSHLDETLASGAAPLLRVPLDVTDRPACHRAARELALKLGKIHVLCNSAGVATHGAVEDSPLRDWDHVLGVNFWGTVNVLSAFVPAMKSHGEGGHIINVASVASFIADAATGVYCTSKFALRGLTECLRLDLLPHRIGVSLLCPGLTRSGLHRSSEAQSSASDVHGRRARHALLAALQSVAMDPDEVGRRTVAAMRRGDFYIFSHTEFRRQIEEINAEILEGFAASRP